MKSSRKSNLVISLSIVLYVSIAIILIYRPYHFSHGHISPLFFTTQGDIDFYVKSTVLIFDQPLDLVDQFMNWYHLKINTEIFAVAGPVFPFLIKITNYSNNNVILLNLLFIFIGILNISVMLNWLERKNLNFFNLVLFAFCPYFILYTYFILYHFSYFI